MRKKLATTGWAAIGTLALVGTVAHSAPGETPDLESNPTTGYVESVDSAIPDGSVRHVIDSGAWRTSQMISASLAESPRIAIRSTGDSWVTWWRGGLPDGVYYRVRNHETGAWSAETRISLTTETSRHPEIVHDGTKGWVAYEVVSGSTTSIAVLGITDSPEPFPTRTIVASTTFGGDVDVLVHSISTHVWTSWVASSSQVGWSVYDHATDSWSSPAYQSYSGSSVAQARAVIQGQVLGN
ncbi:MAG TPA: hypothetical protein VJS92_02465 [Candidatus Polarisedimenticolaceae bacterium]|nr:hypothetical protein [Candidatus Polarisedimenticolaceae bacterium]